LSSGSIYRSDFSYDGLSRLRVRTDYTWNGSSWVVSAITRYIYDGNRVIQERNSGNTPTVAYTRGSDLSGSLEGAGGIGGLLARSDGYSAGNWTNHNYYHADGNGNVTYMINSSQAMVASYRYDPYGRTISSSGSLSAANVYRFSSKEIHVSSGMYYYLYRFYDPNLQRWINRDPAEDLGSQVLIHLRETNTIEAAGDLNSYVFAANNPFLYVDTDGRGLWLIFHPGEWEWPGKLKKWWHDPKNPRPTTIPGTKCQIGIGTPDWVGPPGEGGPPGITISRPWGGPSNEAE